MSLVLVSIILAGWVANIPAQAIYSGPAFGQIAGGVQVSTTLFEGMPQNQPEASAQIYNLYWDVLEPQLLDDSFNRTPAAAPLGSNLYYDPAVSLMPLQTLHAPGVVLDFEGSRDPGNYIPPDPHMAAGPNHVIVVDNSRFIIFDKKGNQLLTVYAQSWFNTLIPSSNPFDCQIIYDHFAGRWVQQWMTVNESNQTSYWMLSVSDDSDPFGIWWNYALPNHLNGSINVFNWGDYPKLGYDHQAIYVSGRQFSFAGTGFAYSKLRILPKTQLYSLSGGPVNYTDIWNFRDPNNPGAGAVDGPPIACLHLDSTDTAYLVVDSPYNTSTFITLWKITNPLSSTPTVTAVNIPTAQAGRPPNANQLGGGTPRIDSGRRAYRTAVYKNGNIWTSTAISGGTAFAYAFARYVRLNAVNNTLLEDAALGANGYYYLYPAVMVDEDDNLVMVFTRSADNEYAAAAFTGRRASDPAGLAPSVVVKEGEANYIKTFGGERNRWGDYMGIALDPVNQNTIWGFIEYAESPANTWGIWTAAFSHHYAVSGIIRTDVTGDPLEFANLEVVETGYRFTTDSTGTFSFGSNQANITVQVSAFAYQDTSVNASLTLYSSDTLEILMRPEILSTISGQVKDLNGNGIESRLLFYARGNPYPGVYATVLTDTNGFYDLQTIIGTYDLEIYPESPFPYATRDSVVLQSSPLTYDILLSPADILLVDADRGQNYEQYYTEALTSLNKTYHLWDTQLNGSPGADVRNSFTDRLMIWFTGDSSHTPLTPTDQVEILDHLQSGGKLFLTGQDIAQYHAGTALLDTLGVGFTQNTATTIVKGVTGDVISGGLILIISSTGGANNQTSSDVIQISNPSVSTPIFYYGNGTTLPAGLRYVNLAFLSKAVFFGYGFEAINDAAKRSQLLSRILDYLAEPVTSIETRQLSGIIPEQFELLQNYPNPFNPETRIRFAVPVVAEVEITIFNALGEKVRELSRERYSPGYYEVIWNGKDNLGLPVSSGVYFYQMFITDKFSQVRKLLLLK